MILFDDMIADVASNKRLPVVTELFMRGWKINISLVFFQTKTFSEISGGQEIWKKTNNHILKSPKNEEKTGGMLRGNTTKNAFVCVSLHSIFLH